MTAPCQNCIDRRLGCHAGCEKYRDYRDQMDAAIAARADAQKVDAVMYERLTERKQRKAKARRWMRVHHK